MQQRSFFQEAGSSAFTYDVRDLENGRFKVGLRTVEMDLPESAKVKMRVTRWQATPCGAANAAGERQLEFTQANSL